MRFFRRRSDRRLLNTIFCIAVCSIPSAVSFRSRQLIAFRRNIGNFDLSGGVSCCRAYRSNHNENIDSIEERSTVSHPSNNDDDKVDYFSRNRRDLLLSTSSSFLGFAGISRSAPAQAIDIFNKKGLYVLNTRDDLSASSTRKEQVGVFPKLSSEYALLRVLPVKNVVFRTVEQNLEALSVLRYRRETSQENINKAWAKAESSIDTALRILVNKRNQLEPVFNPDDSTEVAILKAERGEILLGDLSQDLEYLKESIDLRVCPSNRIPYTVYTVCIQYSILPSFLFRSLCH